MYSIIVASNLGIKCLVVIGNSITSENLITVKEFINNWQIAFISKKKKKKLFWKMWVNWTQLYPQTQLTQSELEPKLTCPLCHAHSLERILLRSCSLLKGIWTVGGLECVVEGGIISLGTRSLKKRYWPTHCSLFFSSLFSFFFSFSLFLFLFFFSFFFFCLEY